MKNTGKAPAGKAPTAIASKQSSSQIKKKKNIQGTSKVFRSTIKRIARSISCDPVPLSSVAMEVLCCIAKTLVEDIADRAVEVAEKVHKQTIGADDIVAAVELLYRGELKSQAMSEIKEALNKHSIKINPR